MDAAECCLNHPPQVWSTPASGRVDSWQLSAKSFSGTCLGLKTATLSNVMLPHQEQPTFNSIYKGPAKPSQFRKAEKCHPSSRVPSRDWSRPFLQLYHSSASPPAHSFFSPSSTGVDHKNTSLRNFSHANFRLGFFFLVNQIATPKTIIFSLNSSSILLNNLTEENLWTQILVWAVFLNNVDICNLEHQDLPFIKPVISKIT